MKFKYLPVPAGLLYLLGMGFIAPWALAETTACSKKPIALHELPALTALNSEAQLANAAIAIAKADKVSADRAPYPTLSLKSSSIDLHNGLGPGSPHQKRIDKGVGLDFVYERADKRQLRTSNAQALLQASEYDGQDSRLTQLMSATAAYVDLAMAQEKRVQLQLMADSANAFAVLSANRLKLGDISAQDAARAQIEYQKSLAEVDSAGLEIERASLALSAVIEVTECPAFWQAKLDWLNEPAEAKSEYLDERPDLRAAKARYEASEHAVQLAQAQKTPDINYGVSYDHFPGSSKALFELRVSVPLQGLKIFGGYNQEGEIARALALKNQAHILLGKQTNLAKIELAKYLQERVALLNKHQRYQEHILPAQQQVVRTAEQAYRIGGLSLTELLEARRQFRTLTLEAITLQAEIVKLDGLAKIRLSRPITP